VLEQNPNTVKIVFKHFPLGFHKQAAAAAQAAIAAHKQGKFWQYHDLLYENHKTLTAQSYEGLATELGLDLAIFNRDRKSPQTRQQMTADINGGKQAGVSGTPAIFVNGHRLKKRTIQDIQTMIDAELKKR
jgi:protein-disulfide isomerase